MRKLTLKRDRTARDKANYDVRCVEGRSSDRDVRRQNTFAENEFIGVRNSPGVDDFVVTTPDRIAIFVRATRTNQRIVADPANENV